MSVSSIITSHVPVVHPRVCVCQQSMARGYAYAKIEYVNVRANVRAYLSKNRIRVRHVSYANLNSPIDISET